MQHRHPTRIKSKITGQNSLQFGGETGNQRLIMLVLENSNLSGNAATGSFTPPTSSIEVSPRLFSELSTHSIPFTIVIEADDNGNVSTCTIANASEKAA